MKKLLLGGFAAVSVLVGGPAVSADLPMKAAPAMVRPACAHFGGFYLGGHVGWGYYNSNYEDRNFIANTIDTDLPRSARLQDDNWHGGVQGGYNWQSGCTVFGVEADWSWTDLRAGGTFSDGDGPGAEDFLTIESRMRWFGTLRARTGIVVDNLLLYVTGGFVYAEFDRDLTIVETGPPLVQATFSSDRLRWGWTAGVGTEWQWSPRWSLKSEFLYMRFSEDDYSITGVTVNTVNFGNPGQVYSINHQDDAWITRIGLNYRF
jgi:outer membrane immunogenic protein